MQSGYGFIAPRRTDNLNNFAFKMKKIDTENAYEAKADTVVIRKDWIGGLKKYMDKIDKASHEKDKDTVNNYIIALLGYLDSIIMLIKDEKK